MIDIFSRNDHRFRCNGTRRVQWQPVDTGSCLVYYTIEFRSTTEGTIGFIVGIRGNSYCTNDYDNSTSVIIWATYRGTRGVKSEKLFFSVTPMTTTWTTITTSLSANTFQGGMYVCTYV